MRATCGVGCLLLHALAKELGFLSPSNHFLSNKDTCEQTVLSVCRTVVRRGVYGGEMRELPRAVCPGGRSEDMDA